MMAPDEASRSDLYALLEPTLGRRAAMLLMNQIPPEGWPEFATRADVELARTRLDGRIDVLEQQLAGAVARLDERIAGSEHAVVAAFRGELVSMTRHIAFGVVGAILSTAIAVLGAVRYG
jgi:hypothetical protein